MNREIKFRAWSKTSKEMININRLDFMLQGGVEPKTYAYPSKGYNKRNPYGFEFDLNDCELMQFTGLEDKNGKEIYEGDIVKVIDNQDGDKIYKIIFEKGSYYGYCIYTPRPSTTPERSLLCDLDYFLHQEKEIIGNIYETPELLKN